MGLMLTGILTFGIVIFVLSYFIVRRYETIEPSQMATYIVLIAWGSLVVGIFLEHITDGALCRTIFGH